MSHGQMTMVVRQINALTMVILYSLIIISALIHSNPKYPSEEHQYHVDLSPSSLDVYYSLSPSSPIKICEVINHVDKKNKKRNIQKKKDKQEIKSHSTTPHCDESLDFPMKTPHNPTFPCTLFKGDQILKYCHCPSQVLEVWFEVSKQPMSSTSVHHSDDTPSTSDSVVKSR